MDCSNSEKVDWPSPLIARLANFKFLDSESKLDSSSDDFSLPNSWGGMTPYEANILATASKSKSPKVSQSPHSRPPKVQPSQKAQKEDRSKSPYSKSDKALKQISNKLKWKPFSLSQPATKSESRKRKRSSTEKAPRNGATEKAPRNGATAKPKNSPKRKSQDVGRRKSTLSPFLCKVMPSCLSVSSNTVHQAHVALSPSGRSSGNKMTASWNVDPLKDHMGTVNGSSTAVASCGRGLSYTIPLKKHIATSPPGRSNESKMTTSCNVYPLKDHKKTGNWSNTTAMEEEAHYKTPLSVEKFCDGLTIPRRKLFSECQGSENKAPKRAFHFKKTKFKFDFLPDVDECLETECDEVCQGSENKAPKRAFHFKKTQFKFDFLPNVDECLETGRSHFVSTEQKTAGQNVELNMNKPSDLDAVPPSKSEPTADESVKQSGNFEKLTEKQYVILRAAFSNNPYPSVGELARIAADFGVSRYKIQTYFTGKRTTIRQKMKRQGVPVNSKEELCFFVQEGRVLDWSGLLLKPDNAEDKDYHIGHEASGGKYLGILYDLGRDLVESY